MDFSGSGVCDYISTFENITKNPEEFLEVQKNDCNVAKRLVKNIYDLAKSLENKENSGNALPELIIENFDEEQIWQEIELQNNDVINEFSSDVTRLCETKDELIFPIRLKKKHVGVENEIPKTKKLNEEMDISDADEEEDEEDNDSEKDSLEDINGKIETESDNELLDSSALNDASKKDKKSKHKSSIVDDEFFKLSEMEDFLLSEEKENNDEKDFGIDLFEDIPSSEDDDDEEEGGDKVRYRYKDFFAQPSANTGNLRNRNAKAKMNARGGNKSDSDREGIGDKSFSDSDLDVDPDEKDGDNDSNEEEKEEEEEEEENDDVSDSGKAGKKVRFTLSDEDEEESKAGDESDDGKNKNLFSDQSDSEGDENDKMKRNEGKSSLEKRKERLSKHIQKLEERALSEKPWQMKGEISATSRPQNSLLEEVLEFDMTSRPAPVMTEQTTEKLEDIIIRRIKDKAWDDVERKLKPVETVNEFKKRLVLDQEKSKLSLAQIYEQEYIKQRDAATAVGLRAEEKEPEELPEHKEIKNMMVSLFAKLNALSNFHYTPKPAAPDIKIISNLPAVTMEEVAPVAASDATLLAPEEVLGKKKKELLGKEERTKTDKKRERRKKKQWQKTKRKIQEAKEVADENKSKKYTMEKAAKDLKKLANNRGVQIESTKNKKTIKTSTAFFSRLQDEVKSKIHGQTKEKKKDQNVISAKRLKL